MSLGISELRRKIFLELGNLDRLDLDGNRTEDLCPRRQSLRLELEVFLREETSPRQKLRILWARDGDVNSELFHKVTSRRCRKSLIKELELRGWWDH